MNQDFQLLFKEVEAILKKYGITKFIINDDLYVDVDGSVRFGGSGLQFFPIKFGKVTGDFYCHENQLTSLQGPPREVGGHFYCSYNQLTSVDGIGQIRGRILADF